MAIPSLSGSYIDETYIRLVQTTGSGAEFADGLGNPITFGQTPTGSLLTTASATGNTITFTKGDGTTFPVTVTGGTGAPGGPEQSLQFNSASAFSGSSNLKYDYVNSNIILTGSLLVTQSHISTVDYIDFTILPTSPAHNQGRLHWLDDTKTLQIDTDVNNFMIEVGHQNVVRGRNVTGFPLTKGTVVYINGESGNRPTFTTASWTGDLTSAATLGFIAETINDNQTGYVVTNGILRGINTNAYLPGTQLYLSSSGQYTSTVPISPLHEVRLGKTITQATDGYIYVDIMNGYEIGELHDVSASVYSNGDLLVYNSGSRVWTNTKTLSGSYTLSGSLSTNNGVSVQSLTASVVSASQITGSLYGTASWAVSASQAISSSYSVSSSYSLSSSYAITSSYALSSSYTLSSSYSLSSSYALSASYAQSASNAINAQTSSYLSAGIYTITASWAQSASNAIHSQTASFLPIGTYNITSSWAINALTASFLPINTYQVTSSWAVSASQAVSSSFAQTAISSSYPISVTGSTLYSVSPLSTNNPNLNDSIFLGNQAGLNAVSAYRSNFLGIQAGYDAITGYESNFLGYLAGFSASSAHNSNFLGSQAGQEAANANNSNFLGVLAGLEATNADRSNFLGQYAGLGATNAGRSNFLGHYAGYASTNAYQSNFLGQQAGQQATNANNSNFLGELAGNRASTGSYSNLIGFQAGKARAYLAESPTEYEDITTITSFDYDEASGLTVVLATTQSIVVEGDYSGLTQPFTCSNFTIIGPTYTINVDLTYYPAPIIDSITYDAFPDQTTFNFVPDLEQQYHNIITEYASIGTNNIIIGTSVTLEDGRQDSINIGGIIFGTGSYYNNDNTINSFTGSAGGRIGINVTNPTHNLEVSGTVAFPSLTEQSQTNVVLIDTSSGQLYYTASSAIGGGSSSPTFPYTGSAIITGSLIVTGSTTSTLGFTGSLFGTSSWATNALTASFLPVNTYNITSSWATNALTASFLPVNTYNITSSWAVSASQAISASFAPNIYNQNGSLTGNRTVTLAANSLTYDSSRTSGTAISINAAQTSANAGDTGDVAMALSYNLTGTGAATQLVTRVFQLGATHARTSTTVSNMRVFNLATNTNASTTTTNLDCIFIENGTAAGTVTNYRGLLINNSQGTNRYGLVVNTIAAGTTIGYLLLGATTIATGTWSIYSANALNSYHNGNFYIGSTTNSGFKLDVTGTTRLNGNTTVAGTATINGNTVITGSLTVSGSSHIIAGPTVVTGSFTVVTGSAIELQVTNTGVRVGNAITDIHTVTGNFNISGSQAVVGNTVLSGSLVFNPGTSPSFNGEIIRFGSGTLTQGQLYFLSSSGTWSLANADSTGSSTGMLGLAVGSSPTSDGLLIRGFAVSSSYTYGTGSIIYMATGSGTMTSTVPTTTNHVVRVLGYQTTLSNTIYFDPDKTWVTLA
jgi:hypothetical protein